MATPAVLGPKLAVTAFGRGVLEARPFQRSNDIASRDLGPELGSCRDADLNRRDERVDEGRRYLVVLE